MTLYNLHEMHKCFNINFKVLIKVFDRVLCVDKNKILKLI